MSAKNVDHGRFRRAFAPSFTEKALRGHEPMIQRHVDILMSQLHREALKKTPFNPFKWFQYITFDVTGELGYSKSFHTLKSAENHGHVDVLGSFLKPYTKECSLRILGMPTTPTFRPFSVSGNVLQKQIVYSKSLGHWVHERLSEGDTPGKPDLMTYFSKHSGEKGLSIYETENAIWDFMIAGTETVSETLLAIFYHLVRNQQVLHSLTDEIRQSFTEDNITADSVAKLPLLNAVINEAMRLAPSIPVVMPRVVTEPGMEACGYWLPAGVRLPEWH
jgi:cytochrome P450